MKALPMQQPWASLVVHGIKSTETRDRHTNHRGPLLIHATRSEALYRDAEAAWDAAAELYDTTGLDLAQRTMEQRDGLPLGGIIGGAIVGGSVRSMDICWRADVEGWQLNGSFPSLHPDQRALGNFGPGRRVWLLGAAVRFEELIECRGMPGMFNAPPDVEAAAILQWPEVTSWSRRWA